MFDFVNGASGGELTVDGLNDNMTNDGYYDEVQSSDIHNLPINTFSGYQDGCFGNDPLSHSKHYQCPKFPGVTLVDSYVRADGTVVDAHWRTNPDGIIVNNFSANK